MHCILKNMCKIEKTPASASLSCSSSHLLSLHGTKTSADAERKKTKQFKLWTIKNAISCPFINPPIWLAVTWQSIHTTWNWSGWTGTNQCFLFLIGILCGRPTQLYGYLQITKENHSTFKKSSKKEERRRGDIL